MVRYVNLTWAQIESTNLTAYIANLQAVGCPKETIRDIILAEVNQSFARSRATEVLTPDQQWWKTETDPAVARAASAQLRQLESGRRASLISLPRAQVGNGDERRGLGGVELWFDRAAFGHAPRKSSGRSMTWPRTARRKWPARIPRRQSRVLQNERARLQNWLTPVALNEYLLRYSPTAAQLRADTRGVNYSPEQFQNLFAAVDPILLQPDYYYRGDNPDALGRQRALQAQYEGALQEALGGETYHALRLNQDPLYAATTAAAQQTGVPAQNIAKLYEINRATQAELDRIRKDATLSPDEKIDALATTRTEQQKAIQQLLGPEAFQRWLQTQTRP